MRSGGTDGHPGHQPSAASGVEAATVPRRSPTPSPAAWVPSARDARTAKGERTRRLVVEALVDLIDEEGTHPTAKQVAQRAGVSMRLVYHHFGGVHGLLLAAVALQSERHRYLLFAIPPRGPPALRIKALCRQRRLYFEEMTPVYRVAHARAHAEAGLDELLAGDRMVLRDQLAHTLDPELESRGAAGPELLDALEQATGWHTWRALRDSRASSAPSAERAMAYVAERLLG